MPSDPGCDPDRIKLVSNDVLNNHTGYDGGVYLVTLAQIENGFVSRAGYRGWSDPVCAGSPLPARDDGRHTGQRTPTRTDRLVALHAQLTAAVEDLAHSDAWRRMLEIAARLPTYSPSNVLLISRPTTRRHPRRRIPDLEDSSAAQCARARRASRSSRPASTADRTTARTRRAASTEARRSRTGRTASCEGSASSTSSTSPRPTGEPLARGRTGSAHAEPHPERLWERPRARSVNDDGFTVERGDCHGANGYTRFDDRTIRVREDVDPAQAVKTLAHELGHVRADHEPRFADSYHRSVTCRGIAEIEAESIAYLITSTAGLDAGDYSVPYVAGWSGGDPALLRASATVVLRSAEKIEEELRHRTATVPERQTASPTPARTWAAARRRPSSRPGPVLER